LLIISVTDGRLNIIRHSLIISCEKVSKILASVLKITKSSDLLSVAFKGQAFKPFNSTGKHLYNSGLYFAVESQCSILAAL
jgi:hypothetical protein